MFFIKTLLTHIFNIKKKINNDLSGNCPSKHIDKIFKNNKLSQVKATNN